IRHHPSLSVLEKTSQDDSIIMYIVFAAAVMSWMQYKEVADAAGIELVKSTFAGDASLLAWAPIGNAGPVLAAQE
ncbi:MAG: hypothetical protein P8R45_03455, partial [Candidatus Binatia bacterium]|nr:hypothetical protein [Candidatus Binatia bacterium]